MNNLIKKLTITGENRISADEVKKTFIKVLEAYTSPAYGAMSKRDFDIMLFMELQDLGVIEMNPDLYALLTELKITRTKARNLLYESKLRRSVGIEELDEDLKRYLVENLVFYKNNDDVIGIEIENPLLVDHIKSRLKPLGFITDGSFSPEMVKLSVNAYLALFKSFIGKDKIKDLEKALVKIEALKDKSFGGIMKSVLKQVATKVGGEVLGDVTSDLVGNVLSPIIGGAMDKVGDVVGKLFDEKD